MTPDPGIEATVTPGGVPPITVELTEDTTISRDGRNYVGGDQVELPGPLAQHFIAAGYATFIREGA